MCKLKIEIGQKFDKLIAIKFIKMKGNSIQYWLFKCNCGKEKIICANSVIRGSTKSCGCLSKKLFIERTKTHGMRNTRIYETWAGMKKRCFNKNCKSYKNYGGRGITICEKWLKFENFYEDMGKSYENHVKKFEEKNTTVDRKNNDKGYYKENCKWSTRKEQANNRRKNKK